MLFAYIFNIYLAYLLDRKAKKRYNISNKLESKSVKASDNTFVEALSWLLASLWRGFGVALAWLSMRSESHGLDYRLQNQAYLEGGEEMQDTERKRIAVFTKRRYLFQKIYLDTEGYADAVLCERIEDAEGASLVLWDELFTLDNSHSAVHFSPDNTSIQKERGQRERAMDATIPDFAVVMGVSENAVLKLPLRLGSIKEMLKSEERTLILHNDERTAQIYGRRVKLTEVEFSLLSLLYEKRGDFVSREDILEAVWKKERDGGVINVYVHYLREKLEVRGERIIISSREEGYCIDKKFFGRDLNA